MAFTKRLTLQQVFGLEGDVNHYWNKEPSVTILSVKKKAWIGDAILAHTVSKLLWKHNEKTSEEKHWSDADALEILTNRRKKYTCNKNLSKFMKIALDCPPLLGTSDHSMGTLFEWLLYLSSEQSEESLENAVKFVMKYMDEFPKEFEAISEPYITFTVYYDQENKIKTIESELGSEKPEDLGKYVVECIEQKSEQVEKEKKTIQKIQDEQRVGWFNQQVLLTEQNPFAEIVPITGSLKMEHKGTLVPINWISGRGNSYTNYFYSCCGLGANSKFCNVVNWPSSERDKIHFGNLQLYSSRKYPGGRAPIGSGLDHVPICKIPKWTCCSKYSFEPGCKSNNNKIEGITGETTTKRTTTTTTTMTTRASTSTMGTITSTTRAGTSTMGTITSTTRAGTSTMGTITSTTRAGTPTMGTITSTTRAGTSTMGTITAPTRAGTSTMGTMITTAGTSTMGTSTRATNTTCTTTTTTQYSTI